MCSEVLLQTCVSSLDVTAVRAAGRLRRVSTANRTRTKNASDYEKASSIRQIPVRLRTLT